MAPVEERRRFRFAANQREVSVHGFGPPASRRSIIKQIFEICARGPEHFRIGLGLAIAKRLIQAHRGKVWVESESRSGSKFTFYCRMDQG